MTKDALLAHLCLERFRGLQRAHLQGAALTSVPLWLAALWHVVPAALAWLAVLVHGANVVMAIVYAVVEAQWRRRAADLQVAPSRVAVHTHSNDWDELRTALWSGLAVVSFVPWAYVAFDRACPRTLLAGAVASGVGVFLLLVLLETAVGLARSLRRVDGGPK